MDWQQAEQEAVSVLPDRSLIPLCLVYFYINSRYSEKLRSDAVVLNQLAEKNTAILLEDYLTKIEYISNLFMIMTCRPLSGARWGRLIITMPASSWKRRCG